jgi:hypothetical protein
MITQLFSADPFYSKMPYSDEVYRHHIDKNKKKCIMFIMISKNVPTDLLNLICKYVTHYSLVEVYEHYDRKYIEYWHFAKKFDFESFRKDSESKAMHATVARLLINDTDSNNVFPSENELD